MGLSGRKGGAKFDPEAFKQYMIELYGELRPEDIEFLELMTGKPYASTEPSTKRSAKRQVWSRLG